LDSALDDRVGVASRAIVRMRREVSPSVARDLESKGVWIQMTISSLTNFIHLERLICQTPLTNGD
jgi:hypothetical protein